MGRQFTDSPAVRSQVPLLVGITGPSGSGKTFSGLRLAKGIQSVIGGDVFGIDTESDRMLHYADYFKFRHVPFAAPFGSLDYLNVLQYCVGKGASVVMVDSTSHEHEGPGGMVDLHDTILDRMCKGEESKRHSLNMLAWSEPKQNRRKLINGILQLRCNFIFCFRAKSIVKPVKVDKKTEMVPQGFTPIAGDEFIYEQTVSCLLLPRSNGVPTWQSDNPGEAMACKLPQQFHKIFEQQQPLSEDIGRQLAEWARGGKPVEATVESVMAEGRAAASNGSEALKAWWGSPNSTMLVRHFGTLSADGKKQLKKAVDTELKPIAIEADKRTIEQPGKRVGIDVDEHGIELPPVGSDGAFPGMGTVGAAER